MHASDVKAVYEGGYRRLVVQLYAVTGDLAAAQELVQDAFVQVLAHPRSVEDEADPEAAVRTVALRRYRTGRRRRALLDRLRRRHPPRRLPPAPDVGPAHAGLVAAVHVLPAEEREVLALHHLGDLSVPETARTMRLSTDMVLARLAAGHTRLAELLAVDPEAGHG